MTTAEKLLKIVGNRQKLYDAGKQAEYEKYWTPMWRNRLADNFNHCFTGLGWNDDNFTPPMGVSPYISSSSSMFERSYIVDLEGILASRNITLDFKHSGYVTSLFNQCSRLKYVPEIDCTGSNSLSNMFNQCKSLVSVRKLILKDTGTNTFTGTFATCTSLVHIRIEGVIGNTIDFSACPLDTESFMGEEITEEKYNTLSETVRKNNVYIKDGKYYYGGVITALKSDSSGKTVSVKKTAKEAAFTDAEWATLTATKSNWTFNLV